MSNTSFQKSITVEKLHLDELNHVNNIVYIQWVQEIAKEHWFSCVPENMKRKYLWVVISHNIQYRRPCFLDEKLLAKTKVGEIDGAKWPRYVSIYKEDGSLAVEAVTVWCLMDAEKMRPLRVNEEVASVFL